MVEGSAMGKNNNVETSKKLVINKKYKFKQDYSDSSLGEIPQGMIAIFIGNCAGCLKFKLPNGKQVAIQEKSVAGIIE